MQPFSQSVFFFPSRPYDNFVVRYQKQEGTFDPTKESELCNLPIVKKGLKEGRVVKIEVKASQSSRSEKLCNIKAIYFEYAIAESTVALPILLFKEGASGQDPRIELLVFKEGKKIAALPPLLMMKPDGEVRGGAEVDELVDEFAREIFSDGLRKTWEVYRKSLDEEIPVNNEDFVPDLVNKLSVHFLKCSQRLASSEDPLRNDFNAVDLTKFLAPIYYDNTIENHLNGFFKDEENTALICDTPLHRQLLTKIHESCGPLKDGERIWPKKQNLNVSSLTLGYTAAVALIAMFVWSFREEWS